ncbi:MAG: EF-hand domain-containing protein [Alphaproteobacteria bacterium]
MTTPFLPMAGLALALMACAGAAQAQTAAQSEVDPDGDGFISQAEAQIGFDQRFQLLDRDRDGRISRTEFMAPRSANEHAGDPAVAMRAQQFGALDTDRDGFIGRTEAQRSFEQRFSAMDRDHDGRIPLREFEGGSAPR